MTICIAAISDGGKNVIVMSDKMITYTAPPFHQFEHPRPKIYKVSENAVILTAGSALLPSDFLIKLNSIKDEIGFEHDEKIEIKKLADLVAKAYRDLRKEIIEERFLLKYDLTWKDYINFVRGGNPSNDSDNPIYSMFGVASPIIKVFAEIEEFKLEFDIILAGVDEAGGHIYVIQDPGIKGNFDDMGYTAIGSGSYHAIRSFVENNYSIDTPLWKALYIVYEAKKYAESAPGVGLETDVAIITNKKVFTLENSDIDILNYIYKNKKEKHEKMLEELYRNTEKDLKDLIEKLIN